MKKATGTITALIFTVMFTLCGCASGDSEGMATVKGTSEEKPLENAEEAANLMERYEIGTAGEEVLERLGKTDSEIVDRGFRLLCSRYVEKCEEQQNCVHRVVDAWTDFGKYMSSDNDFAELLGTMITDYQTTQSNIKAIEGRYTSKEALGEVWNIWPYNFYVQYRIETAYDDTIVGFLEKNLAAATPSKVYYYYANDVVYNSLFESYLAGEVEYVLMCTEPFAKGGAQNVYVAATGAFLTLESSTGFVRDVEIYECIPATQVEQMTEDYNAYEEYFWHKENEESVIYEILTRVAVSGDAQEASGTEIMSPKNLVGTWRNIINVSCDMTITYEEPTYYIEINRPSSFTENTRWVLEGQYDKEQGGISYCVICLEEYV